MNTLNWSSAEKKIARKAYDAALKREYAVLLQQLKSSAEKANSRDDIWDIYDYLTKQRKSIDQRYHYSYSQLIFVFGILLRQKWLEESDLAGLTEDKRQLIRAFANG